MRRIKKGSMERLHRPVLLSEVIEIIKIKHGGVYADFTFGEGGHTEAFLRAGAGQVFSTDRDSEALRLYREHGEFRQDPRLSLFHTRFSEFKAFAGKTRFDGILADLGVSTRQLVVPERGFSFSASGPLDMRMDPASGTTLDEKLDTMDLEELASSLWRNADLKHPYGVARRVLEAHRAGKLKTTADLAALFNDRREKGKSHPATALFMALRMIVNEELKEIETGLPEAVDLLCPGGRLAVITFHSTEDRVVKKLFQELAGRCICAQHPCLCPRVEKVSLVTKKPFTPSAEELATNPRARSAKLRCVEKEPS